MINYIKKTFTFWIEVYRDFKVWRVFRKTANEYKENLNKDFNLRVDWLGRIYGVINLPQEVQGASGEIQQAYVTQQIATYGQFMTKIGLADIVYPQIQRIPKSAGYLVILWPVFDELSFLPIIGGIIKTSIIGFIGFVIFKFFYTNVDTFVGMWEKFSSFVIS
jgi:hypothetical protein